MERTIRWTKTAINQFQLALILVVLSFAGCDPAKLLVIKVDKNETQSIILYTNNRVLPSGNKDDSNKLIIRVPFNNATERIFHYGIGNWPNEVIRDLSTNIDSLVISDGTNKLLFVNKSDIESYLKKHRSGYAGSILTIQAR